MHFVTRAMRATEPVSHVQLILAHPHLQDAARQTSPWQEVAKECGCAQHHLCLDLLHQPVHATMIRQMIMRLEMHVPPNQSELALRA